MLLKTPYKSVHQNLMLTKTGEIWAYYNVSPENINSGDTKRQESSKAKFRYFMQQLAKYKDFHLEMYPRQMELKERFHELEKDFHPDTRKVGKYYNDETVRILTRELESITKNRFLLGVKIKDNLLTKSDDAKGVTKNALTSVTDTLVNLLGFEREVDGSYFDKFTTLESELYQLVLSVNGSRLTEDELVYVNRYNFVRDINHHIEEEKKRRGSYSITDSLIDPSEFGYLKMTTTEGQRYMSYVVVDSTGLNNSYTHLFERAQKLPFPVELHIKGQFQSNDSVLRKTSVVKTRVKQMKKEQNMAGEDSKDSIHDARYVLNRLENTLGNGKEKFINWVATFVVTGKDKKQCKRRAKQLIRIMGNKNIDCVQPLADQLQLFYKFLHGSSLQFEKNWVQKTTCEAFAENLFGVSNMIGNNIGFYIGRVNHYRMNKSIKESIASSRELVLFHPFIANKGIEGAMTDSPHISITGETGKGKSFLVKLLLICLAMLDIQTLYVDPKTEVEVWFRKVIDNPEIRQKYPLFVRLLESFNYVKLNANDEANTGVLDPIVMLEGTDAFDTAQAIIDQIYNMENKDDVKRVFLESLEKVVSQRANGDTVGFIHVIEAMQAHDEVAVKNAGNLLHQQIKNSVLRLNFSDGTVEGLNLDGKVNILGIEGLDLPDAKTPSLSYSDAEKKSLAIMIPLAKFCEKFGARNKDQETVEIFDEGWMLTTARAGKKLIKSMRRVGRSYNNALVLVTQSVGDVHTEEDNGNFGVNFAFDEPSERDEILDFLNMEKTEDNEKLLSQMIKGECMFKDIYGRTGKLAVDCLFEEWAEAFKTVEESHSSKAEKMFA
ncbi:AAA family ATPase [Listeria booriae]|uniref:ATP-binding protein n=1 Tax=Listeria booriae TaxID=1552123 RepID=UPI001624E97D|nr:ATP-binding protein [Listeria booriae]MBC1284865.1 AAA family ATPase [Listeria booriae]